jgi:hypothetical protein
MIVACIGSRHQPPEVRHLLRQLGRRLVERGHAVVSGNGGDSDQAFAAGANEVAPAAVTLCLPWPGFERRAIHPANVVMLWEPGVDDTTCAWAIDGYARRPQAAQQLLARDATIARLCEAAIAWPGAGNGTRTTMRLIREAGKPVTDLSLPETRARLLARLGLGDD